MKRTLFAVLSIATLLLGLYYALRPEKAIWSFRDEEVVFVRELTLEGYRFCNGNVCLHEGDRIIAVTNDGKLHEAYLEDGHMFNLLETFSGPIYSLQEGLFIEVGYLHLEAFAATDDPITCAVFDYFGSGCLTVVKTIEWYNTTPTP